MNVVAIEKDIQVVEASTEVVITVTDRQVQVIEPMPTLIINQNGASTEWVIGETPTGAVKGSNTTFTTEFDFVPESVEVFLETCHLGLLDDYNTSGNNTITFYVSPLTGEKIKVNYQKL